MNDLYVGFFDDFEGRPLYKWSLKKINKSRIVYCAFIIDRRVLGALPSLGKVGSINMAEVENNLYNKLKIDWQSNITTNNFIIFYNERRDLPFNYFGDNIGSFEGGKYSSGQFVAEFIGLPSPIKNTPQMIYETLKIGNKIYDGRRFQ